MPGQGGDQDGVDALVGVRRVVGRDPVVVDDHAVDLDVVAARRVGQRDAVERVTRLRGPPARLQAGGREADLAPRQTSRRSASHHRHGHRGRLHHDHRTGGHDHDRRRRRAAGQLGVGGELLGGSGARGGRGDDAEAERRDVWSGAEVRFLASSWSRAPELEAGVTLDGSPLADLVSRLQRRGRRHGRQPRPDRARLLDQRLPEHRHVLVATLAGHRAPEAALHGLSEVYAALATNVYAVENEYAAPGGTVYEPLPTGAPRPFGVYYPQGCDWGEGQVLPYALFDAQAAAFGFGGPFGTLTDAARAASRHLAEAARMQQRGTDGRTYRGASEYTYVGREEHSAQLAAQLVMTLALVVAVAQAVAPADVDARTPTTCCVHRRRRATSRASWRRRGLRPAEVDVGVVPLEPVPLVERQRRGVVGVGLQVQACRSRPLGRAGEGAAASRWRCRAAAPGVDPHRGDAAPRRRQAQPPDADDPAPSSRTVANACAGEPVRMARAASSSTGRYRGRRRTTRRSAHPPPRLRADTRTPAVARSGWPFRVVFRNQSGRGGQGEGGDAGHVAAAQCLGADRVVRRVETDRTGEGEVGRQAALGIPHARRRRGRPEPGCRGCPRSSPSWPAG